MEKLIKTSKSSSRDAAVEAWAAQVIAIGQEAVQDTKEVFKEKSLNYTLVKLGEELQVYRNRGQQLSILLTAGRLAGYANHPRFEDIKVAAMAEVLSLMESAEQWLEGIKKGLLSVSSVRKRQATNPQPREDVVTLPPVPLPGMPMVKQLAGRRQTLHSSC
jgi:hypothetical protein